MLKPFKYLLFLCIGIWYAIGTAQNTNPFSRKSKEVPFTLYKTRDANLSINAILNKETDFKPASIFTKKSHPKDIYWIKIDLEKELPILATDSLWYLRSRHFEFASIFYNNNGTIREHKFGNFENRPSQKSVISRFNVPFKTNELIKDRYIYLKVQKAVDFSAVNKWKFVYINQLKMKLFQEYYNHHDLKNLIPIYVFVGVCAVMFLFTLMFFIYAKRLEFLFYALYCLFLVLYLTPDILGLHDLFFGNFNLKSYTFFQVAQIAINLFYILFVKYYLNTKIIYPKLDLALKIIAYLLSIVLVLDITFLLTKQFALHINILNIERLIMSLFGLGGMLYLVFKRKNRLALFVVIGSFFYLIGALGFLFFGQRYYMISGSIIEIFVFAAGLTFKIQEENKEKLLLQQEAFLNKTKALRAQINPHFIFNSLSSIQHLVTKNDRVSAIKYLSKFSNLTRSILESSIETNALLSEEIKMLHNYLELEALRFDDAFSYKINIDDAIDTNAIEIPSMLLQPFIENAIIHGLLPKQEGDKIVTINFNINNQVLHCEIDDNGIGREAASKRGHIHKRDKKSRGLEVTKQRLEALTGTKDNIQIIDKEDGSGNTLGTKIIITIPIKI